MCPRTELNCHLTLRTGLFYPLNYRDKKFRLSLYSTKAEAKIACIRGVVHRQNARFGTERQGVQFSPPRHLLSVVEAPHELKMNFTVPIEKFISKIQDRNHLSNHVGCNSWRKKRIRAFPHVVSKNPFSRPW